MRGSPSFPSGPELHAQVQSMQAMALALVGRDEAEDLLARLFLKASERPPKNAANVKGWLLRVLRNEAIDQQRSSKSRLARERNTPPQESPCTPHELLEKSEAQGLVHQAMEELNEANRVLLLKRYFEHQSPQEIAKDLNISIPTARVRLTRALGALRKRLRSKYGDQGMGYCFLATGKYPSLSGVAGGAQSLAPGSTGVPGEMLAAAVLTVFAAAIFWVLNTEDGKLLDAAQVEFPVAMIADSVVGKVEDKIESLERLKANISIPQLKSVDLYDEAGSPIPNARVLLLGPGVTAKCVKSNHFIGHYEFKNAIEILPEGPPEKFLLISVFGHAPYWAPVETPTSGNIQIVLPKRSVVSGRLELPPSKGPIPLFLTLGLKSMRPEVGSEEYAWRAMLNTEQKEIFDGEFHSFGTRVDPDGNFRFEGMAPDWHGVLRFMCGEYQLDDAEESSGFQVIYLADPSEELVLSGKFKPFLKGRIATADGSLLQDDFEITSCSTQNWDNRSGRVALSVESGEYQAFFDELPTGELMLQLRQGGCNGEVQVDWDQASESLDEIVLPERELISCRFLDPSGNPIPGIQFGEEFQNLLPTSGSDGQIKINVPGFADAIKTGFRVDSGKWMPKVVLPSEFSEQIILQPRYGFQVVLEWPKIESESGNVSFGSLGCVEVELACPMGLFANPPTEEQISDWLKYFTTICRDPTNQKIVKLEARLYGVNQLSFLGVDPLGPVQLKVREGDRILAQKEIVLSRRRSFEEFVVLLDGITAKVREAKVLHPDGSPAGFAQVSTAFPHSLGASKQTDAYGIFFLEDFVPGQGLIAHKLGCQPSMIQVVPAEDGQEQVILQLLEGRKVKVDLNLGGGRDRRRAIKCRGIRLADGALFGAHSDRAGGFEFEAGPFEEFQIALESPSWKMFISCEAEKEKVELTLPPEESFSLDLYGTGISSTDLQGLSFSTHFGKLLMKVFEVDPEDDQIILFEMPPISGLLYLEIPNDFSGSPTRIPLQTLDKGDRWHLEVLDS